MYTRVKNQTRVYEEIKKIWFAKYPECKHLAANTLSDYARRLTNKLRIVLPEDLKEVIETTPNLEEVEVVIEKPTNIENRNKLPSNKT